METLSESMLKHIADMSTTNKVKYILPKLIEVGKSCEDRRRNAEVRGHATHAELAEFEKTIVEVATELLILVEMEQFRQRTAIGHYLNGVSDRAFLRRISQSWNGDKTT